MSLSKCHSSPKVNLVWSGALRSLIAPSEPCGPCEKGSQRSEDIQRDPIGFQLLDDPDHIKCLRRSHRLFQRLHRSTLLLKNGYKSSVRCWRDGTNSLLVEWIGQDSPSQGRRSPVVETIWFRFDSFYGGCIAIKYREEELKRVECGMDWYQIIR